MEPTAHTRGYYVTRAMARAVTLTGVAGAAMVAPFAAAAVLCKALGL